MASEFAGTTEITTATRRIARQVNANYGIVYAMYFDAEGREIARTHGPETFGPADYAHKIIVSLFGPQPQKWTQRRVQDLLDNE